MWEMYCHKRAYCGRRAAQIVHMVGTLGKQLELPADAPPAYKVRLLLSR